MKENKVKLFFEDMSISSTYELLEWGKNDDELKDIAAKKDLKVPSKDLSIFKCKYAMVDQENRNKCTLPRKEVKKALKTLNGKAIDKDHFRKATIGYWLDAELDDSDIIAYGAFWKSNFPEDYEEIKKRMREGNMKISFEAWGDRRFKEDGSYDLTNIEFAGGALLFDTKPAFPDAEVMEFSNRVLEFAKIIEEKEVEADGGSSKVEKTIVPKEQDKDLYIEEARLLFDFDTNNIARLVYSYECPNCKSIGYQDIQMIDFENSKIKHKCFGCEEEFLTDLTPNTVIKKKGKKPQISKVTTEEVIPTKDKINKEEVSKVMDEILKKYNKASIEELIKFLESEISTAKESFDKQTAELASKVQEITARDTELTTMKTEKETMLKTIEESKLMIENSKIELEKVKAEFATIKAELDKRLADEKAAIVKVRKDEIGEYAKDMTDEDILNDLKFENAKLKKERDEAIKKASEVTKGNEGLPAGQPVDNEDPQAKQRKVVQEKAWQTKEEKQIEK